jgi:pimeloyl-ACP methyl ester carboxylesterase
MEDKVAQPARIRTPVLDVAYEASGPADGLTVLLLHGFPYDVRSFDHVVALIKCGRLPHHRSLAARLWLHSLPLGGHATVR